MIARKGIDCTPEIASWRRANPIRKWLDAQPRPRGARLALLRKGLGVTRQAVYRWMHGISLPGTKRLVAIAKITNCSLPAYLRWWDEMPQGDQSPCVVQPQASESTHPRS